MACDVALPERLAPAADQPRVYGRRGTRDLAKARAATPALATAIEFSVSALKSV